MRLNTRTWPIFSAYSRRNKIDPKPAYQRGPVWSVSQQQLFVDSILRGYDIPKLYLRSNPRQQYEYEIIDGQQRLTAIWRYLDNKYALSDESDAVQGHQIAGELFEDIHDDLKQELQAYELSIVVVEDAQDDEVEDMFLRLQNGVPLNSAEKRNAISGQMRDFIHKTAETHKLMEVANFNNNRYAHDEIVAQMLSVELNGGPTSVRHNQLKSMYQAYKTFKVNSPEAKKFRRVLDFLAKAFPNKSPYLSKVNLFSLYTVASGMISKYALPGREAEFGSWFLDFEDRRRKEEDQPGDQRDERSISYQLALQQQTASMASQEQRKRTLAEDLLGTIVDLAQLDDQRVFSEEQRISIFRKARGKCVNPENNSDCIIDCEWDNWNADHIVPHSRGGKTTVANGQLLCPSCNLKKSDRVI